MSWRLLFLMPDDNPSRGRKFVSLNMNSSRFLFSKCTTLAKKREKESVDGLLSGCIQLSLFVGGGGEEEMKSKGEKSWIGIFLGFIYQIASLFSPWIDWTAALDHKKSQMQKSCTQGNFCSDGLPNSSDMGKGYRLGRHCLPVKEHASLWQGLGYGEWRAVSLAWGGVCPIQKLRNWLSWEFPQSLTTVVMSVLSVTEDKMYRLWKVSQAPSWKLRFLFLSSHACFHSQSNSQALLGV